MGVLTQARNLSRRSTFEQLWLIPVWSLLGLVRLALLSVAFRRLAPWLGQACGPSPWVPLLSAEQTSLARQISRSVQLAARFTPWTSNCFPQAIVAVLLLKLYRVPCALNLGLARSPIGPGMEAHAWVSAGAVHVTGGDCYPQFTVVGCFVTSSHDR